MILKWFRMIFLRLYNVEIINLFHATIFSLYPLKTSENQRFSDVFRRYRKRPVAWNRLIEIHTVWFQTINTTSIFSCYFNNLDFLPSLVSNDANCTLPNPYPENYNNQTEEFKKEFESNRRWRCMIKQSTIGQMALGK